MFISKRQIKDKPYFYLEEKVNGKRISIFLGNKKKAKEKTENAFDELVRKITLEKTKHAQDKFHSKELSFSDILILERLKVDFELIKKFFPQGFKSFKEDEFIRYAQGSASVEGNSLNLQQASIILSKGAAIAGKKINEIKEIENLKKAANITEKIKEINENNIKKIHSAIMAGFKEKHPGEYRKGPIFITGSKVKPVNARNVKNEMKKLIGWYKKEKQTHSIELCSKFHARFEKIHPFEDGNGRIGREILNWMLQKEKYPRAIINLENRESYIILLERVQLSKQYNKFTGFIFTCLKKRATEIEKIIKENKKLIIEKLSEKI